MAEQCKAFARQEVERLSELSLVVPLCKVFCCDTYLRRRKKGLGLVRTVCGEGLRGGRKAAVSVIYFNAQCAHRG